MAEACLAARPGFEQGFNLCTPRTMPCSRKQLKALVTLHSKDEGFGGRLTGDEIQIITGALDLTRKTAYHAMTPLDKVGRLVTPPLDWLCACSLVRQSNVLNMVA